MFRTLLRPSSGAHDYSSDYHMDRLVLGLLLVGSMVQAGWISVRAAGYSRAITCSPDTYPAGLHLTSNKRQPKNGQPMW